MMHRLLLVALCFIVSFVGEAVEAEYKFSSLENENAFKQLTAELRCPKCQNQNIADSDALVAQDLKNKVYELLEQGHNQQQVIDFMIDRYGYFVHYKPPVTMQTLILWCLPVLFLVFGVFFVLLKSRNETRIKNGQPIRTVDWTEQEELRLQTLMIQHQQTSDTPAKHDPNQSEGSV